MVCTFFGHRDTPKTIESALHASLIDLIENKGVNLFYVGNNGNFDYMVRKQLMQLKFDYPHINYFVVLAYMPGKINEFDTQDYSDTIYPQGLENTPPRFAIAERNKWMINQSDYVLTYVKYDIGGASRFKELAERKGKTVINLADLPKSV